MGGRGQRGGGEGRGRAKRIGGRRRRGELCLVIKRKLRLMTVEVASGGAGG